MGRKSRVRNPSGAGETFSNTRMSAVLAAPASEKMSKYANNGWPFMITSKIRRSSAPRSEEHTSELHSLATRPSSDLKHTDVGGIGCPGVRENVEVRQQRVAVHDYVEDTPVLGSIARIVHPENHFREIEPQLVLARGKRNSIGKIAGAKTPEWRLVGRGEHEWVPHGSLLSSQSH